MYEWSGKISQTQKKKKEKKEVLETHKEDVLSMFYKILLLWKYYIG